jgi:hypothetical protein
VGSVKVVENHWMAIQYEITTSVIAQNERAFAKTRLSRNKYLFLVGTN